MALAYYEEAIIESRRYYVKQTDRNRCRILMANKVGILTVPVEKVSGKLPYKEVKIYKDGLWQKQIWRSIQSAYGKSPYFEYYAEDYEKILFRKFDFLFDLNYELLTLTLNKLGWSQYTLKSIDFQEGASDCTDLRDQLSSRQSLKPLAGIEKYELYTQNFGKDFVPNLSIIDLLFCEGPMASTILKKGLAPK